MNGFLENQVWNSELGRVVSWVGCVLVMLEFSTDFSQLDSFSEWAWVLGQVFVRVMWVLEYLYIDLFP